MGVADCEVESDELHPKKETNNIKINLFIKFFF